MKKIITAGLIGLFLSTSAMAGLTAYTEYWTMTSWKYISPGMPFTMCTYRVDQYSAGRIIGTRIDIRQGNEPRAGQKICPLDGTGSR